MEITLSKVVEAARQRRAAVTAEGGGYIVLLALQQLATSPRQVRAELIALTAAGDIELGASPPAQPREVETQLRQLLTVLLTLSHSAPPALRATGERAAVGDLAALEAELAAALIPVNHAAARRALARLFRETQKATRVASSAEPNEHEASSPLPSALSLPSSETPLPSSRATSPAAAPGPATRVAVSIPPPPAADVALTELELDVDVDIVLADGGASDSTVAADGELAAHPASGVNGIVAAATEIAPASDAPATSHATLAEVDDVDIDVDDLDVDDIEDIDDIDVDGLDELLTAELAPSELSFTSLSNSPLIVRSDDDALVESPLPDSSPFAAPGEPAPEPPPHRSDLRDLLHGYLSHTRSEEHMTADLRRRIGLEPWRAPVAALERPELGR